MCFFCCCCTQVSQIRFASSCFVKITLYGCHCVSTKISFMISKSILICTMLDLIIIIISMFVVLLLIPSRLLNPLAKLDSSEFRGSLCSKIRCKSDAKLTRQSFYVIFKFVENLLCSILSRIYILPFKMIPQEYSF